jgi:hypothetical protein
MKGHCVCLPISTYGHKGVGKNGVHVEDHAVIFTGKKPFMTEEEITKGLGARQPISVVPDSPRGKLDKMSRLNYAKPYTVEYNIKVWFIGRIAEKSMARIAVDYNDVHPPVAAPLPAPLPAPPWLGDASSSYSQYPSLNQASYQSGSSSVATPSYGQVQTSSYTASSSQQQYERDDDLYDKD